MSLQHQALAHPTRAARTKRKPARPAALSQAASSEQPPAAATLAAIHTVLHLVFVRNKNQHGRAKWWKHLSVLRHDVRRLLALTEAFEHYLEQEGVSWEEVRVDVAGSTLVDLDGVLIGGRSTEIVALGRYMAAVHIPRAYVAFSTVVADTQFASLGLVLIAVLAQLNAATSCFAAAAEEEQGGVIEAGEEENEEEGEEQEAGRIAGTGPVLDESESQTSAQRPDLGEVVDRKTDTTGGEPSSTSQPAARSPTLPDEESHEEECVAVEAQRVQSVEPAPTLLQLATRKKQPEERAGVETAGQTPRKRKKEREKTEKQKQKQKQKKHKSSGKTGRNAIDDIFGGL
ncbi:hypothetical protein KEM52_006338 [Ascosphaera acerosa]|nr:hypothetical protein KEM52_006338 [Ascosphaera acerosa]